MGDDPLDGESANLYNSDRDKYNDKVKEFVKKHAMPEKVEEPAVPEVETTPVETTETEEVVTPPALATRQSSVYELIQQHSHVDEEELEISEEDGLTPPVATVQTNLDSLNIGDESSYHNHGEDLTQDQINELNQWRIGF